ncbi:MAG: 30S ribosomal protein S17 [Candidatus Paceibacterota bacterium]
MTNKTDNKIVSQKQLEGVVVSDAMDKTIVVEVARLVKHPKYGKFVTIHKKYKAHDEGNVYHKGDKVTIVECVPISKDKHFTVVTA